MIPLFFQKKAEIAERKCAYFCSAGLSGDLN
jgi:hypothetical protein